MDTWLDDFGRELRVAGLSIADSLPRLSSRLVDMGDRARLVAFDRPEPQRYTPKELARLDFLYNRGARYFSLPLEKQAEAEYSQEWGRLCDAAGLHPSGAIKR